MNVTDAELQRFSETVSSRLGLHFPRARWADLQRGLESAAREFGFGDSKSCLDWLLSVELTKGHVATLANHLTVGETYFFRDHSTLVALKEHVFPRLIDMRRGGEQRLRIWSAGCCTGEEPYTIAIILAMLIPDLANWDVTILATDVSASFLRKAEAGSYRRWSFRQTPRPIRDRYFRKSGEDRYKIVPAIRRMVTFSYINLSQGVYPSLWNNTNAHDVVVCRNVLMYFNPEVARKVVERFSRVLVDGGWLTVSATESPILNGSSFDRVGLPGCTLYQKPPAVLEEAAMTVRQEVAGESTDRPVLAAPTGYPEAGRKATSGRTSAGRVAGSELRKPKKAGQRPNRYENALSAYRLGRYDEAARILEELLGGPVAETPAASAEFEPAALLARAYANQGKLADAERWCRRAVDVEKLNPVARYLLAVVLQEKGALKQAEAALKGAIYLDESFVVAHLALGNLARQEGNRRQSATHFKNALSLLTRVAPESVVPESEGVTAGRLTEIIRSMIDERGAA